MFSLDKRTLYILLAIIMLFNLRNMNIEAVILSIPGLLIAITFHEFAHAFAADKLGDDTPRQQGRLNLNPLSHLDPIGCILLLIGGFGWGKPVQINPRNFDSKVSMSKGEAIVSFAGPLMNFILAFLFLMLYYAVIKFNLLGSMDEMIIRVVTLIIYSIVMINIGLGVFNLIPLPPLDGSKILKHFLSYNAKQWFENHEHIFYMVFMLLFITGISSYIILPLINGAYGLLDGLVRLIFRF